MRISLAIVIFVLSAFISRAFSQELYQNVRGTVRDRESMAPLPGATVIIRDSDPLIGTTTDAEGKFCLKGVPVGRHTVSVSYIGYEEINIPEIMVSSARETLLHLDLHESVSTLGEVVIRPEEEKGRPVNDMSMISSRSFTVEETKRYPASISDPARMALSFAGVTGGDDSGNEIIIRGNAPSTMLWRMEGIEIPSPNHFAEEGYSSGYVSILSANLIDKSDFLTGAFSGEYGNAISGVFDMRMRNGNNMKRETALQLGVLGTDISMEGPFRKGYGGSYLFNYRYSTLSIMESLGLIPDAGGIPKYQDLSFKVNLPAGKAGVFSIWGIGGTAISQEKDRMDPEEWESRYDRMTFKFTTGMGAAGISHTWFPDDRSYLKSTIAITGNRSADYEQLYPVEGLGSENPEVGDPELFYKDKYEQTSLKANILYNRKLNSRISSRSGLTYSYLNYMMKAEGIDEENGNVWREWLAQQGNTWMLQGYESMKFRLNPKFSIAAGLHMLYFGLNEEFSAEPRLAFKLQCSDRQSIGLAAGIHSRHDEMGTYFARIPIAPGMYSTPNTQLKLRKAFHVVLSHEHLLAKDLRLTVEAYYQHLWNLPVAADTGFTYCAVNGTSTLSYNDTLVSNGIGRNFGLEMTLEKFFTQRYYFMLTGSLFDSKYRASNGEWYNTRFNVHFAINLVGGKEFALGRKKNNFLGVNMKLTWAGGMRDTPIDLEKSVGEGYAVYIQDQQYELSHRDYFRTDFSINYTLNRSKVSHTFSLDIQNLTNNRNMMFEYYDPDLNEVKMEYHMGLLPVLAYKIEF